MISCSVICFVDQLRLQVWPYHHLLNSRDLLAQWSPLNCIMVAYFFRIHADFLAHCHNQTSEILCHVSFDRNEECPQSMRPLAYKPKCLEILSAEFSRDQKNLYQNLFTKSLWIPIELTALIWHGPKIASIDNSHMFVGFSSCLQRILTIFDNNDKILPSNVIL